MNKKGFTLIELMVVVAIIALLTGIVTVNLTKSRSKSRDAKRVSDLGQLQLALELVFDRCNKYPTRISTTDFRVPTTVVCTKNGTPISINTFMSTVPTQQPYNVSGNLDTNHYRYAANGTLIVPSTDYVLGTRLENYSDVLVDDNDAAIFTNLMPYYFACTDGPLYNYCVKSQ